jgi:1,4-alpha-glucan branching enzyme
VPQGGYWKEVLNSDSRDYDGSGLGNMGGVRTDDVPMHNFGCSLKLALPPLSALFLKPGDR